MSDRLAEMPNDTCRCGDFRREHAPGGRACRVGRCGCQQFRLSETEAEYAARHPKHYATLQRIGLARKP